MSIDKWKIRNSEYLYRETWFTVRKDTCETIEGKIISPYYVYEFPTWVTILPITEEGQVIMVKQYRHAIGEIILEIPGGCVDDTAPPDDLILVCGSVFLVGEVPVKL